MAGQAKSQAGQVHKLLRLQTYGGMAVLQPVRDGQVEPESLSIDMQSGSVKLLGHAPMDKGFREVFGIAAVAKLASSTVLVVITGAEQVAILRGHPVYKIKSTEVVGGSHLNSKDDAQYVRLLSSAFNPLENGTGLFFAHGGDLTLTQQRYTSLAADPKAAQKSQCARADPRFFWNKHHTTLLADAGLDAFAVPIIMGSVAQLGDLEFESATRHLTASLTLLARRSLRRAGTRHWRRGADLQGAVANFVETEQLLVMKSTTQHVVSSYIQVRGSIPLLWSQIPDMKYKPPTRIAPVEIYQPAFNKHFKELLELYKEVVAVSLVNLHGSEGILAQAFQEEADRFTQTTSGLQLVAFDFHKECAGSKYHNLSILWGKLERDWQRMGYFYEEGQTRERQSGVVRTNCIDCLDRTNVVQGVLGRKHLESVLRRLQLLQPGSGLPEAFPGVEQRFKILWADHGDDISRQYAGTGALKSGFTRTGKRTKMGLLDDGLKSAMRYYLNTFQDGRKQDAVDLATGAFEVPKPKGAVGNPKDSPFRPQPSVTLPIMLAVGTATWSLGNLSALIRGQVDYPSFTKYSELFLIPFTLAILLMLFIFRFGAFFVGKPQLCPKLAQVWK